MSENYREPEDLLTDPSFLSWYYKTGERNDRTWEDWMNGHPDRKALVEGAIALLKAVRLPEKEDSLQQLHKAETALMGKLEALSDSPVVAGPGIRKPTVIGRYRWIAAASVLVVLAAGFLITHYVYRGRPQVRTEFGQISHQQLPDGTDVTMNANTRLSYSPGWKDGEDREVWVDGEAFFHVRKTPLKSRFIVHSEHFDIIVTGTQFNVSNRHGKDNVLLQEGSVTLRDKRDGRTLVMKPGDFITFDAKQGPQKLSCNESLLCWRDQKLMLDHTSIGQLATIIGDLYGTPVKLEGDSTADRTISAILPTNNLDILLKALEATAEFDIVRDPSNDGIIIRAHSQKN